MEDTHNKLKNLKDFIKSKTDLGTTNYIMKEINEVCGMVETEQLRQYNVSGQREQLVKFSHYIQKHKNEGLNFDCVEREVDAYLTNYH